MEHSLPLPKYETPPVIEVALSVQFKPLTKLKSPELGLLWAEYKEKFPKAEQHPPLPTAEESFEKRLQRVTVELEFSESASVPRYWFITELGTELVQVQQDKFVFNWRRIGGSDAYPSYSHVRKLFIEQINVFRRFIKREDLGDLEINQCELTYVNHLAGGEGWERFGQLDQVLSTWNASYSDSFLSEPEDVRLAIRHLIPNEAGTPLGRLYTSLEPARRVPDGREIMILTLSARGKPEGEGFDGAMRFLDKGHEWVVRGFTSLTTPNMQKIWRRTQ